GPLAEWPDKSPAQRAVHQSTSALQPTVTAPAQGLNGRPVVSFDGLNDSLAVDGNFRDFTEGLSWIAVITPRDSTVRHQIIWYVGLGSTPPSEADSISVAEDGSSWFYTSNTYGSGASGLTVDKPVILGLYVTHGPPKDPVQQFICNQETLV